MDIVDRYSLRGFDCLCGNLRMAARAVTSVYDEHLQPAGVQASQMAVLWAVSAMSGATIKEIARQIAMDETTLLRNLRVLERRGWIALDVGEDRRQRLVSLTAEGREVFARALPLWERAQKKVARVIAGGGVRDVNAQLLRLSRVAR